MKIERLEIMEMFNWIIFYCILPIALGVFGNFATPWVKSYLERSSLTIKQRSIKILIERYKYIKRLRQDTVYLNLYAFWWACMGLMLLVFFVGQSAVLILIAIVATISVEMFAAQRTIFLSFVVGLTITMLAIVAILTPVILHLRNSMRFKVYREKTLAKLIKLGGNPEDLDKEEGS